MNLLSLICQCLWMTYSAWIQCHSLLLRQCTVLQYCWQRHPTADWYDIRDLTLLKQPWCSSPARHAFSTDFFLLLVHSTTSIQQTSTWWVQQWDDACQALRRDAAMSDQTAAGPPQPPRQRLSSTLTHSAFSHTSRTPPQRPTHQTNQARVMSITRETKERFS